MSAVPGVFDSLGGTYDANTVKAFNKTLYAQTRYQTILGPLSMGKPGVAGVAGQKGSLNGSAVMDRKMISEGDQVRFTMHEHMVGNSIHGDLEPQRTDYLGFKNLDARINISKSPVLPVQGKMAQQRIKGSVAVSLPDLCRTQVQEYMAEEMEFELFNSFWAGASKNVLLTTRGGLGHSLGIDGASGVPLMPMNFFTVDSGWIDYSTVAATHNSDVNSAINTITQTADEVSLAALRRIRSGLDKRKWRGTTFMGKKCKAVIVLDPDMFYRIDNLLGTAYQTALPRGSENLFFQQDYLLYYKEMIFISAPNFEKYRPAYNASQGYPDFGPGLTQDPRTYTTSSNIGLMAILGAGAIKEGYNGMIEVLTEKGYMDTGLEYSSRTMLGFQRSEWFAKDGRDGSDAAYCDNFAMAAFYEPGVGTDY